MTPNKVGLAELNALITCSICKGYFVDATTVTECLHTFCRSCIVKHFQRSLFCPECEVQVEKGCPLNKLRPDPRKQLLVYKVVPRLHANEMTRQQLFLKKYTSANPVNQNGVSSSTQRPLLPENLSHVETVRDRIVDKIHLYSPEEKLSLSVEYESGLSHTSSMNQDLGIDKQVNPHKRYLQCPAAFTIGLLKKFIRLKYDIGAKQTITIFYEGEPLLDSSSLMDVAYQFFYDSKSPMRFTYRVTPGYVVKPASSELAQPTPAPSKPPTLVPTVLVKPLSMASLAPAAGRQPSRGSASSSDESSTSTSTRRQQRQRSAKTAAYSAIEAMDESDQEEPPVKRRRLPGKSPRWESDRDSPEPYTVYRNTRRTPKTSLEDFEARYNTKPSGKRVYAICSDDEVSDPETKRNTLANRNSSSRYSNLLHILKAEKDANRPRFVSNGKKSRKKKEEDVYEFNAQNEDNDSNTTQEFDFVYDNSDYESTESDRLRKEADNVTEGHENNTAVDESADMQEVEADEHELEQQIEMEVVTDTEDMDRHIEESIEEVEVDADDDSQGHEASQCVEDDNDNHLEAETTSSSCLVIAEDEDDDGVVEEVIAAEEEGHELVVVEDPEESDVTYTVQVYNVGSTDNGDKVSEESSSSPRHSASSTSPTVEEDEPEILHEKVIRKKSKKSKHHHHHHHHKRKRHHSPVMLVSNSEDAPMKLTLKLRPTPSISPGNSKSSKSHSDSSKEKRVSICLSPSRDMTGRESPSQKIYTVKITSPKPPADEKSINDSPKETTPVQHMPLPKSASTEKPAETSPSKGTSPETKANVPVEKVPVADNSSKEKLSQTRQVRIQSPAISCTPASPPPSPSPSKTSYMPDLKSVKTPSSLTISKVEAGETPQRTEEPSNKPALEILVLPPSPPPSDKQGDDSEGCATIPEPVPKKKETISASAKKSSVKDTRTNSLLGDARHSALDQACVLDLSDRAKRDSIPLPPPLAAPAISPISSYMAPRVPPPPVQYILHPPGAQPEASLSSAQLRNLHNMIDEATIATVNRMNNMLAQGQPVMPNMPLFPQVYQNQALNAVNAQRRLLPTPSLNSMIGGRRGGAYGVGPSGAGTSRPNQSVRHIPNPSALLHRQQSGGHGKLTEQELKERLQQFQQNQQNRAAKAAYTYSRANNAPVRSGVAGPSVPHSSPSVAGLGTVAPASVGNGLGPAVAATSNSNLAKNAIRPRSIEKVAGLLSVRAGVSM